MVMYNKAWVHEYVLPYSPVTMLIAALVNVRGGIQRTVCGYLGAAAHHVRM